jgi:hypothetical protein
MEWTALGMVVLLLGLMAGIAFAVFRKRRGPPQN